MHVLLKHIYIHIGLEATSAVVRCRRNLIFTFRLEKQLMLEENLIYILAKQRSHSLCIEMKLNYIYGVFCCCCVESFLCNIYIFIHIFAHPPASSFYSFFLARLLTDFFSFCKSALFELTMCKCNEIYTNISFCII